MNRQKEPGSSLGIAVTCVVVAIILWSLFFAKSKPVDDTDFSDPPSRDHRGW